jgi:hypothetical protein
MTEPVPHPPFSWSHSRDRALLDCSRAYYWRHYGSHGGWVRDASPESRLAYALKHLTTYPLVLGTAVHACARDCVVATRNGEPRPAVDAMLAQVSAALNRTLLGSHRRGAFLRDPRHIPMLRDAWYTGRQESAGLVAAVAKARVCLRVLSEAAVWDEIEACRPEWIAVADSPEAFVHEGWPVYAGPDAVYRPGGRYVVILDWKTGDETDAELQIALYALYCRKALGMRFRDGEWFGRVVNLATGSDTVSEISRVDLLRAADRIRDSVGAMHALLANAQTNEPRPKEDFPLAPRQQRDRCSRCEFFALCENELARADAVQP